MVFVSRVLTLRILLLFILLCVNSYAGLLCHLQIVNDTPYSIVLDKGYIDSDSDTFYDFQLKTTEWQMNMYDEKTTKGILPPKSEAYLDVEFPKQKYIGCIIKKLYGDIHKIRGVKFFVFESHLPSISEKYSYCVKTFFYESNNKELRIVRFDEKSNAVGCDVKFCLRNPKNLMD